MSMLIWCIHRWLVTFLHRRYAVFPAATVRSVPLPEFARLLDRNATPPVPLISVIVYVCAALCVMFGAGKLIAPVPS